MPNVICAEGKDVFPLPWEGAFVIEISKSTWDLNEDVVHSLFPIPLEPMNPRPSSPEPKNVGEPHIEPVKPVEPIDSTESVESE